MMSHEEQRQQHETINTMAEQLATLQQVGKKVVKIWPVISLFGVLIGGAFGFAWGAFQFNATLIKRPEFDNHLNVENANTKTVSRSLIIDSTVNKVQDQRLDKLESAKSTRVTATRDNNGVHFNPVN